ncbi:MAG: packaged DNA stabilization protein gp10 [Magnetococcus sp. WYHC-3]
MNWIELPFIGGSGAGRDLVLSSQEAINLQPMQFRDSGGRAALVATPGLTRLWSLGEGPVRAMLTMGPKLYVVSGQGLYQVDSNGRSRRLGELPGRGRVSLAHNGRQLVLVPEDGGGAAWLWSESLGMTPIRDVDFPPAAAVTFMDGFFVFAQRGSGRFFISRLYDGGDYNALEFATAEGLPDALVTVCADHRELWLMGERSIEVWFNAGNADFPFERLSGGFAERGCAAAFSVVKLDNSLVWLGDDRVVYRAEGYVPRRVSHQALEQMLADCPRVDDAFAQCLHQDGRSLYMLTLPGADATWVLDPATGHWHRRASHGQGRHRANVTAWCFGLSLVGDGESGALFCWDPDNPREDGVPLRRERTTAMTSAEGRLLVMHELELLLAPGRGQLLDPSREPRLMLQWSDDGGRRWSEERWRSMGALGDSQRRVVFHRLGRFRQRLLRLVVTDAVPVILLGARARVEVLE